MGVIERITADLIGTRGDTIRTGDDHVHLETVRQRALNALRNPECTREFLAHAVADIEWLAELAERGVNVDEYESPDSCDECGRLEDQLQDARDDRDEAQAELKALEERLAELKDELGQLHFRATRKAR